MFNRSDPEKEIQELLPLIDEYVTEMMINFGEDEAKKIRATYSVERLRGMSSDERQRLLAKLHEFQNMQQNFAKKISQSLDDYKKNNPNS